MFSDPATLVAKGMLLVNPIKRDSLPFGCLDKEDNEDTISDGSPILQMKLIIR